MYDDKRAHFLLLLIVCFFSFFVNNEVLYPDIMESRNLITAHEMVEYDNWLVPTMNGELRMEKPPLPTWIAAGIELISPDNIVLQRAAAGCMATLMVFFIYLFASYQSRNRLLGLIAALVLSTSYNIILLGRTSSWDIYCHSFMLGGIYFLYKGLTQERTRWKDFLIAGVWMALSFMSKGPVAFYAMLLPFLISYVLIYRPTLQGKAGPFVAMAVVCLLLCAWWPIYLYLFHKDMALYILEKESMAWIQRNVRPWYYYWQFFFETGVWSFFLAIALCWPFWKNKIRLRKEYLFAVCWTLTTLVLLSLMPEKKTRYLLPILVPAALAVAHLFVYWRNVAKQPTSLPWVKLLFKINVSIVALIVLCMPVGLYVLFYTKGTMALWLFVLVSILSVLLAVLMFQSVKRMLIMQFLGSVVSFFVMVELFFLPQVAGLFLNQDMKSIRAVRMIEQVKGLPFYYIAHEPFRIELVYEAGCRIQAWNPDSTEVPPAGLPFVLVSEKEAAQTLPATLLERVELTPVDVYDNNRRPKNTKRYSDIFVRHVTLIKEKEKE